MMLHFYTVPMSNYQKFCSPENLLTPTNLTNGLFKIIEMKGKDD